MTYLPDGMYQPDDTSKGDANWTAVGFLNSWANAGGADQTCKYRKDGRNWVHLTGILSKAGINVADNTFVLPAGYRPAQHIRLNNCHSNNTWYEWAINSDGLVYVVYADGVSATRISMCGIKFLAEL